MKVELKLYASLRSYLPEDIDGKNSELHVDEGKTVGELIRELSIPEDAPKILFVNGIHADKARVLEDGDRLALFPPIAGG